MSEVMTIKFTTHAKILSAFGGNEEVTRDFISATAKTIDELGVDTAERLFKAQLDLLYDLRDSEKRSDFHAE